MNLRIHFFLFILWSSGSFSIAENGTPRFTKAFTLFKNAKIDPQMNYQIQNMPRIQSQDSWGSCLGCSPTTISQKHACDTDDEIKKLNRPCSDLPNNLLISQLSMVAWSDTNETRTRENPGTQKAGRAENHTNIRSYKDKTEFTTAPNALMNSAAIFRFMPESCFPFDQLVQKYGTQNSGLFEKIYENTKLLYLKNRTDPNTGAAAPCVDCLAELNSDFNTKFSSASLSSALNKKTYGEFLYSLFFSSCTPIQFSESAEYKQFPDRRSEVIKREQAESIIFEKIRSVLDSKHPVQVSALCLQPSKDNLACDAEHSLVISGYRNACPTDNFSDTKCKRQFKVHNCWGADWQKFNDDGWVNADEFIKYIDYGKPAIGSGVISWLE